MTRLVLILALIPLLLVGCTGRQEDEQQAEAVQKPKAPPADDAAVPAADEAAAPAPTLGPGDLELAIKLDDEPRPAALTDAIERDLTLTLTRRTPAGFKGTLSLGAPTGLDVEGKAKTFDFDLTRSTTTTLKTTLSIPAGVGRVQLAYPIEVRVGGDTYLTMDLIVMKSVAWRLIGPFEGGPDESHDTAFPPEKQIDFTATYKGKGGRTVRWNPFPAEAIESNGRYDIDRALGGVDQATAYATVDVYAPREMDARIQLGSDDSIKVWQNGTLVHDNKVFRPADPNQDQVDVTLAKGKNTFLVKVCDGDGGWAFFFDLVDKDGKPLEGVQDSIALSRVFLTDPVLRLTDVTRTSASVRWRSDVPNAAKVIVRRAVQGRAVTYPGPLPKSDMVKADPAAEPIIVSADALTMDHTATVTGLEPGTRYLVSVDPACGGDASEPLSFYTAAPEGTTQVVHLKTICIICTNVCDKEYADKPGAKEPASRELVERVKWEHEQTVRFYYVNSGMRFMVDVNYVVDDTFYPITVKDQWYGAAYSELNDKEQLFRDILAKRGEKPSDYDATIMVSFTKYWHEGDKAFHFDHGGGGTVGVLPETGLGKSGWRVGENSNSAWLMCHEFQHQIDSLYHESMGPEHLFCHFQPWDDTAHRHGEHWDGISWIFREWAGYVTREHQGFPLLEPKLGFRYFTLRWGTVRRYADADNDGIPDDAPELPLDEKRLGSDPHKADTDGDGLSDMMEVMACRWIEYGLGDSWAGPSSTHFCNLRNPDTDGDGLKDGVDPYPIYPIDPKIRKAPNAAGPIARDNFRPFATVNDPTFKAKYYLAWNDDYLAIGMESEQKPRHLRLCLDLDDNGWFFGHDNYDMEVFPNGGARWGEEWHGNEDKTFIFAFHNCGVPGKWPFYDRTGLRDGEIAMAQEQTPDGKYRVEIRVPKNAANGLELVEGEPIGIMLTISPEGGINRQWEYNALSVFEPHTFFTFELAK
jgi:hypothetical protein